MPRTTSKPDPRETKYRLLQIQATEMKKLKASLEQVTKETEELQKKLTSKREDRAGQSVCPSLLSSNKTYVELLQNYVRQQSLPVLKEEQRALQARIEALKRTISESQAQHVVRMKQLQEKHAADMALREREQTAAKAHATSVQFQLAELRTEAADTIETMQEEIATLERNDNSLDTKLAAVQLQVQHLTRLASGTPSARTNVDSHQAATEALEEDVAAKRLRVQQLQQQVTMARSELQRQQQEDARIVTELQMQIAALR